MREHDLAQAEHEAAGGEGSGETVMIIILGLIATAWVAYRLRIVGASDNGTVPIGSVQSTSTVMKGQFMNAYTDDPQRDGGVADKQSQTNAGDGHTAVAARREHDTYAMVFAQLMSEGPGLENDYGELSRPWGCTVVSGYPRFAVWFNDTAEGNTPAAAVLADLRAWLPCVRLTEVGFGPNDGTLSRWCMLVEMDNDPYKVLLDESYVVEEMVNEWLDERLVAAGSLVTRVEDDAVAEHEVTPKGPRRNNGSRTKCDGNSPRQARVVRACRVRKSR